MATLRELKGRIGSVASSEKITGAMKMISSAKMHKAEAALKRLVPFRTQISGIIAHLLSADTPCSSPLVESREVSSIAIVVMGSDDGLCGAYNNYIFKCLVQNINSLKEKYGEKCAIDIIPVGKKIAKAVAKLATPTIKIVQPEGINSKTDGSASDGFMAGFEKNFIEKRYDLVKVVYTHYYTAGRQRQECDQLLPVESSTFAVEGAASRADVKPCLFEPSAEAIFRAVLPLFLMSTMQEYFAQNRASEQAARVMAMQSANDNATKLLEQLQLEYNKLRQQSITTELLDIVGGQVRD